MTILFITNNLPPVVDGVGDYTYNIARQFAMHRHKVYIACRENAEVNTHVEGMTIVPCVKAWNWSCYKPIVRLIREKGIEVVSLQYVPHGFHPKGLPFPLIKLVHEVKRCKVKLFTFFHEVGVEAEKGNVKRTLLSLLMLYISKKIVENSDSVATSIEYYRSMILKLVPEEKGNVSLIPIASNIPASSLTEAEIGRLRKKIAPHGESIVSFFGMRDVESSLAAISELKRDGYNLKALIIGKTSSKLPQLLPEDTVKTGILPIDEIDAYFKISDIFILPENQKYGCSFKSGSLIAALRNKLPVITSKGKLTSLLLRDGKEILFTDFTSAGKVKEAIASMLDSPARREEIGLSGYRVVENFTWEATYNAYLKVI